MNKWLLRYYFFYGKSVCNFPHLWVILCVVATWMLEFPSGNTYDGKIYFHPVDYELAFSKVPMDTNTLVTVGLKLMGWWSGVLHCYTNTLIPYVICTNTPLVLSQGFSIIFSSGPRRAEDSSKIDVWEPNDHHCPLYFYVFGSWQRAKQVWAAIWEGLFYPNHIFILYFPMCSGLQHVDTVELTADRGYLLWTNPRGSIEVKFKYGKSGEDFR